MTIENSRVTAITEHRMTMLRQVVRQLGGHQAVLWLLDSSPGADVLLTSYYLGDDLNARTKLYDTSVPVDQSLAPLNTGTLPYDLHIELLALIEKAGLDPFEFQLIPIRVDRPLNQPTTSLVGILAIDCPEKNIQGNEAVFDAFATKIELDRHHRIIHAVNATQKLFNSIHADVDSSIMIIGNMVRSEIGAERCAYLNRDAYDGWIEVLTNDEKADSDTKLKHLSITLPGSAHEKNIVRKQSVLVKSTSKEIELEEAIIIPFIQSAYVLESTRFSPASEFTEKLNSCLCNDISLVYYQKQSYGYLQRRFSTTDVAIAKSVFGYIEKYTTAKIFENNLSRILKFLKEKSVSALASEDMLAFLKSISHRFSNVFYIKATNVETNIRISVECAVDNTHLRDEYLERIKVNYLEKFYSDTELIKYEGMYVGIETHSDHADIEIHFPSSIYGSRIYITRFEALEIPEYVLRPLINLFSEMHVRARKEEQQNDRGSYLMQVRHAVIHHFSAANRSIKSLKPLWDRGSRRKEYWLDLLSDPLIGSELSRCINSLGQANLIIENGRFALTEIEKSSLNRKPYRISESIKNILDVLQDAREEKRIVIVSKIIGSAPKIMNADEPLISIALMNIFDNAIKYSPYYKRIKWELEYLKESYKFSVSSVGDVLDPSKKHLLFQVGYRGAQRDRLNQRHGTGLGLPVAYKILQAHSSIAELTYVAVGEEEGLGGRGNRFTFEMPYLTGQSSEYRVLE